MTTSTGSQPWNGNHYASRSRWASLENFNGHVALWLHRQLLIDTQASPVYSTKEERVTAGTRRPSSSNSYNQINSGHSAIHQSPRDFKRCTLQSSFKLTFRPVSFSSHERWMKPLLCARFIKALLSKLIWNGMLGLPWRHAEAGASRCNSPAQRRKRPPRHFQKPKRHFIVCWIIKGK